MESATSVDGASRFRVVLVGLIMLAACSSGERSRPSALTEPTDAVAATGAPDTTAPPPSVTPVTEAATTIPATVPATEPATTTTIDPTLPTPWTDAVAAFDPEADPSVDAALRLFTMVFGPVPGAPEPPEDSGASGDVTIAVRAVRGVWDQLSAAQQAAVDKALHPQNAVIHVVGEGFRTAPPDAALVAAINEDAKNMRAAIAAKIGNFTGKLTVVVATKDNAKHDYGMADPTVRADGTFTGDCTITVFPQARASAEELINTVAHEVFHCFQFSGYGSNAGWARGTKWVTEGGAEWAAATISTPDASTANRWTRYLSSPTKPLQNKDYDAIGFWAHLAESGVDPWSVFRSVWAAAGTPAAFDAAGANTDAFLDSWGSGYVRNAALGAAWDTTGPGIVPTGFGPIAAPLSASGAVAKVTPPFASAVFVIETEADVLIVRETSGHARLTNSKVDTPDLGEARFCRRPDGCACPTVPNDIPPAPLLGFPVLALSGAPTGTSVSLEGVTLELHCEERAKQPVRIHLDRPASTGVLEGTVLDLVSCNGPYGDWSGVLRLGGLSTGGFEVPFKELPVAFSVGGVGVRTVPVAVAGVVPTPVFDVAVSYDLQVTIDGATMTIAGTGSAATDLFAIEDALPGLAPLPIEPAPPGVCPDSG